MKLEPASGSSPVVTLSWSDLTWKAALIAAAVLVGILIYAAMAAFAARMIARKFIPKENIDHPLPIFGGMLWPIAPIVLSFVYAVVFATRLGYRAAGPKVKASKEAESNLPEAKIVNR